LHDKAAAKPEAIRNSGLLEWIQWCATSNACLAASCVTYKQPLVHGNHGTAQPQDKNLNLRQLNMPKLLYA